MPQNSEKLFGIQIEGSGPFIKQTKEALNLLQKFHSLGVIQRYVGVIKESERSGMKAYEEPPVYEVGKATWSNSTIWYAGTIAHDSYHSKLYHDEKERVMREPDNSVWTGAEAERQCLKYQVTILKKIGADEQTIKYVEDLEKNPTYQGDPNSAADYKKRSW